MDGYAVRAGDTAGASPESPVRLRVIADLPAGYVAEAHVETGTAIRIMTGAPIPSGADGVVKVEDTRAANGWVDIHTAIEAGQFVRPAGEDVRRGNVPGRLPRRRHHKKGVLLGPIAAYWAW